MKNISRALSILLLVTPIHLHASHKNKRSHNHAKNQQPAKPQIITLSAEDKERNETILQNIKKTNNLESLKQIEAAFKQLSTANIDEETKIYVERKIQEINSISESIAKNGKEKTPQELAEQFSQSVVLSNIIDQAKEKYQKLEKQESKIKEDKESQNKILANAITQLLEVKSEREAEIKKIEADLEKKKLSLTKVNEIISEKKEAYKKAQDQSQAKSNTKAESKQPDDTEESDSKATDETGSHCIIS